MVQKKLSQREKLILAFLDIYGEAPTGHIMRVVYLGRRVYLGKESQYILRTLHRLESRELISKDSTGTVWLITNRGKEVLVGKRNETDNTPST